MAPDELLYPCAPRESVDRPRLAPPWFVYGFDGPYVMRCGMRYKRLDDNDEVRAWAKEELRLEEYSHGVAAALECDEIPMCCATVEHLKRLAVRPLIFIDDVPVCPLTFGP